MSTVAKIAERFGASMKNLRLASPRARREPRRIDPGAGFLVRLAQCLNVTVYELAHIADVEAVDLIRAMRAPKNMLVPYHLDPMYENIRKYVDEQIGLLISVRHELNRKLADDAKRRLAQRMRVENV
jgi:hypothetical protein